MFSTRAVLGGCSMTRRLRRGCSVATLSTRARVRRGCCEDRAPGASNTLRTTGRARESCGIGRSRLQATTGRHGLHVGGRRWSRASSTPACSTSSMIVTVLVGAGRASPSARQPQRDFATANRPRAGACCSPIGCPESDERLAVRSEGLQRVRDQRVPRERRCRGRRAGGCVSSCSRRPARGAAGAHDAARLPLARGQSLSRHRIERRRRTGPRLVPQRGARSDATVEVGVETSPRRQRSSAPRSVTPPSPRSSPRRRPRSHSR